MGAGAGNDDFGVPRELRKLLSIRMTEEGWDNIRQFCKGTGVPYSLETVRRAFNECPYKRLDTITLAIIMQHLNYSPSEIKAILVKYVAKDDPVISLIGDQEARSLNNAEEKLIDAYRMLVQKDPGVANQLADYIDLLGKGLGLKIKKVTDAIRR